MIMPLNLKKKKIIAREFVFFVIILFITLLGFLYTVYYNSHLNKKIAHTKAQIESNTNRAHPLAKVYSDKLQKQKWFYSRVNEKFDIDPIHILNYEMLWSNFQRIVEHDSMAIRFNQTWSPDIRQGYIDIGFKSAEQLQSFIQRNIITENDIKNNNEASHLYASNQGFVWDADNMSGLFYNSPKQLLFSLYTFLWAMAILFGLRYLFYGIVWSAKTLKQKNE